MAKVQEYYGLSGTYPSSPQPQARFTYGLNLSEPLYGYDDLPREAPMAQPLLQNPFSLEQGVHQSQWPMPQECIQPPLSNNTIHRPNQLWEQLPAYGSSMIWNGLPNEPLTMSKTDHSMLENGYLLYNQHARQNARGKTGMDFGENSFWASNGLTDNHPGAMVPKSEADILLSPVSPFSDAKHMYSPGPDGDQTSPGCDAASYTLTPSMKASSSPDFIPLTPLSGSLGQHQPGSTTVHNGFGFPVSPVGTWPLIGSTDAANVETPCSSEQAYEHSRASSPGSAPWYPPGYRAKQPAMVQSTSSHQMSPPRDGHSNNRGPSSYMTFVDRNTRQRQPQWSNTRNGVPAQGHFETRFIAPMTAGEKAQRATDDATLLQMKQDGFTYKDIRKALRSKVAESTLRGRYRSLIKPRKERVRAPKWTEIDIVLLKRYVQEELDKLDVTHPSLETKQKPDKIPWMKIVESIAANGGTYKFGAATAKKKWVEVTHTAPTRSSRRRSKA